MHNKDSNLLHLHNIHLVTDFQEKDSIKAAVLYIRAGGVGLTLTASTSYLCRPILDCGIVLIELATNLTLKLLSRKRERCFTTSTTRTRALRKQDNHK
ncbi:hypothetical protein PIB30_099827 [Stylosanthes scabra]|uniref:Uncharacterized protein n=1 Tax=Stylosanthes scabra TaxID=79078 RepID=A0ABU6YUM9_9FABA|nr:hypothetical protein [Stylosanthes scabra]